MKNARPEFHVLAPDDLASFASESGTPKAQPASLDTEDLLLQFPQEAVRPPAGDFYAPPPASRRTSARGMAAAGVACVVVASTAGGWWAIRQRSASVPDGPVATIAANQRPVAEPAQPEARYAPAPESETLALQAARDLPPVEPAPAVSRQTDALAAVLPAQKAAIAPAAVPPPPPARAVREPAPSRDRTNGGQLGTSGPRTAETNAPNRSRPSLDVVPADVKPLTSAAVQPPRVVEQPAALRAPETSFAANSLPAPPPAIQPATPPPQPAAPVSTTPAQPQAFATTVAPRSEQSEIQQTLGQYRSAYQRLDAQAARAVWPSVDVQALGRAFSSLTAQQLAFDSCNFDIAGDNATAHCTGSATYTPKVGGRGPRSELRQWTFQLRKATDGWKIQTARIRRDD